jgi:dUTPase
MEFTLGIKKLFQNALHPTRNAPNLDHQLLCSEDTIIPAHSTGLLKTGLAARVPSKTYVRVIPDLSHHAISGPVVNKIDGDTLDVLVFNASFEDVTVKRGNPIARIILVAQAEVIVVAEITPLKNSDTFKYLNDINSHVIDDVPEELRQWCLVQHKDTARIRSGDSTRLSPDVTEWSVYGFDDAGKQLWQKNLQVKVPYNAWTSSITPETSLQWFSTHDREILYVQSRFSECTDITHVLKRLAKNLPVSRVLSTKKQVCIAIGGRNILKASAIALECYIKHNDAFEVLRNLPLYYVNLDDTTQCVLAKCVRTDIDYDACIF